MQAVRNAVTVVTLPAPALRIVRQRSMNPARSVRAQARWPSSDARKETENLVSAPAMSRDLPGDWLLDWPLEW